MLKTIARRLALLFCSLLLDGVIQNVFDWSHRLTSVITVCCEDDVSRVGRADCGVRAYDRLRCA